MSILKKLVSGILLLAPYTTTQAMESPHKPNVVIDIKDPEYVKKTQSDVTLELDEEEVVASLYQNAPGTELFRLDNGTWLAMHPNGSGQIFDAAGSQVIGLVSRNKQ